MIGITMDITERKRTEEALRKSVFRFQRFAESNLIGIAIADMNRIIEANDVFLDIIGHSREDLTRNIGWIAMTPPEQLPRDMHAVEEMKTLGACSPFEKELIRKDGRRVPILIGATVLEPHPLEWMCFVIDLSALKQVERELREARDDLENRVAQFALTNLWLLCPACRTKSRSAKKPNRRCASFPPACCTFRTRNAAVLRGNCTTPPVKASPRCA